MFHYCYLVFNATIWTVSVVFLQRICQDPSLQLSHSVPLFFLMAVNWKYFGDQLITVCTVCKWRIFFMYKYDECVLLSQWNDPHFQNYLLPLLLWNNLYLFLCPQHIDFIDNFCKMGNYHSHNMTHFILDLSSSCW